MAFSFLAQSDFGQDVRMWIGVVENRDDPLQLGRCQCRIFGYHTPDKSLIPTEDLPWAAPINSLNSASFSGVGQAPVGPMIGTVIIGFWGDYPDCQIPLMFGTMNQIYNQDGTTQTPGLMQSSNLINDNTTSGPGNIHPTGSGPQWLQIARGEIGTKEWPGSDHNPEVMKYGKRQGYTSDDSGHPWCAAFVQWCLEKAGKDITGMTGYSGAALTSPAMRRVQTPELGSIVVMNLRHNGRRPSHVAFWIGRRGGRDLILGGNQGNKVSESSVSTSKVVGYFMPKGGGDSQS